MGIPSVLKALNVVFKQNNYRLLLVLLTLIFVFIYISIPVITIPGNDYFFTISIISAIEWLNILVLSFLLGLLFTMQAYTWKHKAYSATNTAVGMMGMASSIFASLTCIACISVFLSFLGFAAVNFIFNHKLEITIVSYTLMLISLYLTSLRVLGKCVCCGKRGDG